MGFLRAFFLIQNEMTASGLQLLKDLEGLELTAYRDVGGVLTIGYGHTGNDVYEGMTISVQKAEQLLIDDLRKFINYVDKVEGVSKLNPYQKDALYSMAYNIGFQFGSTLKAAILSGSQTELENAIRLYNKVNGKPHQGIINRREREIAHSRMPYNEEVVVVSGNKKGGMAAILLAAWGTSQLF